LAKDDKLAHRPDCDYGENVFMVLHPGKKVTAAEVVGHWYKEIEKHTFLVEPPDTSSGTPSLIKSFIKTSFSHTPNIELYPWCYLSIVLPVSLFFYGQ
jgi:hypothetical protein